MPPLRYNRAQPGQINSFEEVDMSRSRLFLIALASLALLSAAPHTVTRVGIVARPEVYRGPCPANIQFTATIHVSHPSFVEYQWVRSDGALGQRQRVEIRGEGRGVTDRWRLGGAHEHLVIWEQLRVLAPTGISSPRARVNVYCR
jgi:hypothetical protein